MSNLRTSNHRQYMGEDNFWRIRHFLQETYPITPLELNWEVRRWDGVVFYTVESSMPSEKRGKIRLWEGSDESLLGVAYLERPGEVHLFLHPEACGLENEMLTWAEVTFSTGGKSVGTHLRTFCLDDDRERSERLALRGYQAGEAIEVFRRQSLPVPVAPVARLPAD